jgi:hypothetical protein
MVGDRLARGAKSATFGPAKISQSKWDAIWEPEQTIQESITDGEPPKPESDNHQLGTE